MSSIIKEKCVCVAAAVPACKNSTFSFRPTHMWQKKRPFVILHVWFSEGEKNAAPEKIS
jgi:hypothetical protein